MKKILCPNCMSSEVTTTATVHGIASVRINTPNLEVCELPDYVECDYDDLDSDEYNCEHCDNTFHDREAIKMSLSFGKGKSVCYYKIADAPTSINWFKLVNKNAEV